MTLLVLLDYIVLVLFCVFVAKYHIVILHRYQVVSGEEFNGT